MRLHDGMFHGTVIKTGNRGFGFANWRGTETLYFHVGNYRRPVAGRDPLGEVEIQYTGDPVANDLNGFDPEEGEKIIFRLSENPKGPFAVRWCFQRDWEKAADEANKMIDADETRERELQAEAARREAEELEQRRLHPRSVEEAESLGWTKFQEGPQTIMHLEIPGKGKKSLTFNAPKQRKVRGATKSQRKLQRASAA